MSEYRRCVLAGIWMVAWTVLFLRLGTSPTSSVNIPATSTVFALTDSGLACVLNDSNLSYEWFWSATSVWDVPAGRERPSPLHAHDQPLSIALFPNQPLFVLREGVVHQVDVGTGESLRHWDSITNAKTVSLSPDRTRLLVQQLDGQFSVVDATSGTALLDQQLLPAKVSLLGTWLNDEFVQLFDPQDGNLIVEVATGRNWQLEMYPFAVGRVGERVLFLEHTGTGFRVVDIDTKEPLREILIQQERSFPRHGQLRFTAEGDVLLDYVGPDGRLTTKCWKLAGGSEPKVQFTAFQVAANGCVLSVVPSKQTGLRAGIHELQSAAKEWVLGGPPREQRTSTVYDASGNVLICVTHWVPGINFNEGEDAHLVHDGRGLVLVNGNQLQYYDIPPRRFTAVYWFGLLAPVLVAFLLGRWHRSRNQRHLQGLETMRDATEGKLEQQRREDTKHNAAL